MSKKAGLAPNGNIIPMVISKYLIDGTGTGKAIDKFLQLTTKLAAIKGGAGGNGGYGGGYSGSTGRQSSVGIGGAGRINQGGFGGGGSGGANITPGGIGGSIAYAEIGGGQIPASARSMAGLVNGINGIGGIGNNRLTTTLSSQVSGIARGAGGGGTGSGSAFNTADTEYAGGFLLIIAHGNITINSGAYLKANGGAGDAGLAAVLFGVLS